MKYRVEYMVTLTGTMEVEAESEEEARNVVTDDMSAERLSINAASGDFEVFVNDCEPEDEKEDPTP